MLWLDSLASLASLLADEEVPKDTEARLVQLAAGWPALCVIQAKAMKVTKEGGSANRVAEAEARRIIMVMKQLRALELDLPTPTLADMADQLRRFIAWHAKECKPRVDALVTKKHAGLGRLHEGEGGAGADTAEGGAGAAGGGDRGDRRA